MTFVLMRSGTTKAAVAWSLSVALLDRLSVSGSGKLAMLMTNDVTLDQIDDFFRNILCEIGDAFQVSGCTETMDSQHDEIGVFTHQIMNQADDNTIQAIDVVICPNDLA